MNKSYLKELIIAVLAGIIFWQHSCNGGKRMWVLKEPEAKVITKTEIVHDTLTRKIPVPVPSPSDTIFVQVPIWADTTKALQTFYNKYFFKQQLGDSNLVVTISDTISQNRIIARDFSYNILRPTEVNTTTILPPEEREARLLLGFRLGGMKDGFTSFGPEIEYIAPNNRAFSISYNFNVQSVELGMKWCLISGKR